jgi:hypothetical protein
MKPREALPRVPQQASFPDPSGLQGTGAGTITSHMTPAPQKPNSDSSSMPLNPDVKLYHPTLPPASSECHSLNHGRDVGLE